MQRAQRLTGLDPELVDEQAAPGGERLERLGLASRPVEGEHQLAAQAFPQRMLGHQSLELGDRLAMAAEREPRIDVVLDGGDPQLLQAADRLLGEALVAHVGQRRPAPQRERLGEGVRRVLGVAGAAPLRDELLEAPHVELVGRHARDVPGSLGDDQSRRRPVGLDRLAQLGHVALQRGRRRRRRRLAPDEVDQPLTRDDVVGVQQEDRQHASLARTAERRRLFTGSRLDAAEEPEVRFPAQGATVPRPLAVY